MDSAKLRAVFLRRRTSLRRPALILGFLVTMTLCGPLAHATEVYAYLGSNYTSASGVYTTADHISGLLFTSSPLAPDLNGLSITPTGYDFSDGLFDYSSTNSTGSFTLGTDSFGTINSWDIILRADPSSTPWSLIATISGIIEINNGVDFADVFVGVPPDQYNSMAHVYYPPGSGKWGPDFDPPAPPAGVPEPATLFLTLPALLAVAIRLRRRTALGLRRSMPTRHC